MGRPYRQGPPLSRTESHRKNGQMKDMRIALPALWIFMVLNYLYCDVLSLFDPAVLRDVMAGHASGGTVQITPEFLLASSVLMEIPMAMILLTRVLGHTLSRWANVASAAFMIVVQIASLFVGTPASYYVFFTVVEVGTLVLIAALALRWTGVGRGAVAAAAA